MTNSEEDNILDLLILDQFEREPNNTSNKYSSNRTLEFEIPFFLRDQRVSDETSLERIERNLDDLRNKVATKDDIISQTNILLVSQKQQNIDLGKKIDILRTMQEANVAYKRLRKYSLLFLLFFGFSFLTRIFLGVIIVNPKWNNIGLLFSFLFFIMSFAMAIDWKKQIS